MYLSSKLVTPLTLVVLVLVHGRFAEAQAIVVQQPVVQQFGVSTVVSVPDRGGALLGSVGSSAIFSRRTGPLSGGVNVLRQQRHAGASASVWIHEFAAMDAALLAAGENGRQRDLPGGFPTSLTGMSAVACDQLLQQHRQIERRLNVPRRPMQSTVVGRTSKSVQHSRPTTARVPF